MIGIQRRLTVGVAVDQETEEFMLTDVDGARKNTLGRDDRPASSREHHAGEIELQRLLGKILRVRLLPEGTYELRVRVTNGSREISRSSFFTLQERD